MTGERGVAIQRAIEEQLGLTILEVKPVGLEGSGGSTPLRLRVEGEPDAVPVRQALRQEPRHGRPLVQARAHDPLRRAGGRGAVPHGSPAGRVRGLRPAGAARRRTSPRPRRTASSRSPPSASTCSSPSFVDGGAEIGEADVVVDDRVIDAGLSLDPQALGRRPRPSRHQAREPVGARQPGVPDRPVLRAGAPVALASGRRPGQHDAGPRGALRSRSGLRARVEVLHPRRDRRGVRRHPGRGQPHPAPHRDEAGRARPPGELPRPGSRATAHRHPALERAPLRARHRGVVVFVFIVVASGRASCPRCRTSRSPRPPSAARAAPSS